MKWVCIKDGIVTNIILAEPNMLPMVAGNYDEVVAFPTDGTVVDIGYYYGGSIFTPPPDQSVLAPEDATEPNMTPEEIQKILMARMSACRAFGERLIIQFGAENLQLKLNSAQVATMAAKLVNVQLLLMTGSLSTAYALIKTVKPDAIITQARLDQYAQQILDFLASLPPSPVK